MRSLAILGAILSFYTIPAFAQVDYDALKHVDLRDLGTAWEGEPRTYLHSTSNAILARMQANPAMFVGPVGQDGIPNANAPTTVVYWPNGAEGPRGDEVRNEADGKTYWVLDPESDPKQHQRTLSRKNTIFSAEFEEIVEEVVNQKFKLKTILFVHDPNNPVGAMSNGYYFRRLWILVDYTDPNKREADISVLSAEPDIPLTAVQFQISGDILERKLVLEDVVYGITKIFPLGVGSFHIRTGKYMDGQVRSMTREFKQGSYLETTSVADSGSGGNNTRMRLYPSYYAGRPFFGIKTADGTYHSIGLHWRIDMDRLHRGFVSHGCIRTQDKDLYQLDAFLNEGGQQRIPVVMANRLGGRFERMSHPYPFEKTTYWAAVYSSAPTEKTVKCRFNTYQVIFDKRNPRIHTVADNSCLTYTYQINGDPMEVVNYILTGQNPPQGIYAGGLQHVPLAAESGDVGALECYNPEGGETERENDRNDLEKFFDDLGSGRLFQNMFKSRSQRRAEREAARLTCDQKLRLIPVDPETPLQAPIQPVYLPDFTPQIQSGVVPVVNQPVVKTAVPAVESDAQPVAMNDQPAVTVQTPPPAQPTQLKPNNCGEKDAVCLLDIANDRVNNITNWIIDFCHYDVIPEENVAMCADWEAKEKTWRQYRDQLQTAVNNRQQQ